MKTCTKCNIEKENVLFRLHRNKCKECMFSYNKFYRQNNKEKLKQKRREDYLKNKEKTKQYNKKYKLNNKEKLKQKNKEYRIKNKDKITQKSHFYYLNNKEKFKQKNKEYYLNNKEKLNKQKKEYNLNNKEKRKQYNKKYQLNNKEEIKQDKKKYRIKNKEKINKKDRKRRLENKDKINLRSKNRIKSDPTYKLRCYVSVSINKFLKSIGHSKNNNSILNYLPYTIEQLKNYIESLFEPWMNWKNHGVYKVNIWNDNDQSTWVWQLDHIIPHSTFNYISMDCEEFRKCWSLENLRPYSAKQNILDGTNRTRHKT